MTEKTTTTGATLVVAMTRSGIIGVAGRLPWSLPEDLRLFRKLTWGGTVLMGRATFESLPAPLAGRHNLVVSRTLEKAPGAEVWPSPEAALARARQLGRPIFIIGGRQLYRATLPHCEQLVVSWVEGDFPGDIHFPEVDWSNWERIREEHHPGFRRCWYRRRKPAGKGF